MLKYFLEIFSLKYIKCKNTARRNTLLGARSKYFVDKWIMGIIGISSYALWRSCHDLAWRHVLLSRTIIFGDHNYYKQRFLNFKNFTEIVQKIAFTWRPTENASETKVINIGWKWIGIACFEIHKKANWSKKYTWKLLFSPYETRN